MRMLKLRSSLGIAVAVVALAGLAQTPPGHAALRGLGLSAAPAGYTALSFARAGALPTTLPTPAATATAPFQIRNATSAAHRYRWSITLRQGTASRRLATGTTEVAAGRTVTVSKPVTFSCPSGRVRLTVSLAAPPESIGLWASCGSPGGTS